MSAHRWTITANPKASAAPPFIFTTISAFAGWMLVAEGGGVHCMAKGNKVLAGATYKRTAIKGHILTTSSTYIENVIVSLAGWARNTMKR
ncbi:hypothetical protein GQ54DRAFT_295942 [Martensiomyces pterosporus]|nr:hypothetical protein GQ54DRAFT_295942 [Martensiomyces pterosporus]